MDDPDLELLVARLIRNFSRLQLSCCKQKLGIASDNYQHHQSIPQIVDIVMLLCKAGPQQRIRIDYPCTRRELPTTTRIVTSENVIIDLVIVKSLLPKL